MKYHSSLQKYTKEVIDFFSGTDLDVRKSIENIIDNLVLINKTMNSYKNSLQVAPNKNPEKYIKEYITQVEETFSKQITQAKQEVLDSITSKNEADQIIGMMRIYNLMLKVYSQIRAESSKLLTPKVQIEQSEQQDISALQPEKYSRRKFKKILEQMKNSENEFKMTLNNSADVNALTEGKKQLTEMLNKVNKLISQTDAQSRISDRPEYKMKLIKLRDLFKERLESLNGIAEQYSEVLEKSSKGVSSSLVDHKDKLEEIDNLLNSSKNPTLVTTSNEQSSPRSIKAVLHTPTTVHKEADSPKPQSSKPNR